MTLTDADTAALHAFAGLEGAAVERAPAIDQGGTHDALAARLLGAPTFADALGRDALSGERFRREMRQEPAIRLADQTVRALVTEGVHRVVSARPEPDAARMESPELAEAERAQTYALFCDQMLARLRRPFGRVLYDAMDAVGSGHKLFEAEVDTSPDGTLVARDYAPKPRTSYELRTDRANRLIGAVPSGGGTNDLVPATNLLVFSLFGEDDDPNGAGSLESAYGPYRRKQIARPVELKSLETNAAGLVWAESGAGASPTVKRVTGRDSAGNPITVDEPTTTAVARELRQFRAGRIAALPLGWTLKTAQPAPKGAFDAHYDRCDREMVMAFLVAPRALLEAQHGSKADSESAGGFLASLRDFLRGLLCGAVQLQCFLPILLANFGEECRDLLPRYEITTVEQSDNSRGLYAYNAAFAVLTNEQRRALQAALNIPTATDEDLDAIAATLLQTRGGGAAEATFSGEPPESVAARYARLAAERHPRSPEAFKKSRTAQEELASVLIRSDKAFGRLVIALSEGTLTRSEFDDDAALLLGRGHDAALRLGLKAAGSKARKVAEDSLAETLTTELEYLADLADGIESGDVSAAMARSRSRNYVRRMRGTANMAFHESSPDDAEFRWVLGANEDHCEQCPRYARMTTDAPWLKDEVFARPGEGLTPCRMGCQCRLVRTDGAEGFGPVEFDPLGGQEDEE